MNGLQCYVLDIESTGLSTKLHETVEIGIVRVADRVQLFREIRAEHPENASYDALKITNKTLEDLNNGVSKEEAVEAVDGFFSKDGSTPAGRVIIGHNIISFDKKMLFALWEKVGKCFQANLWIDTIAMTKEFIKTIDANDPKLVKTATGKISKTLHSACDMTGVKKIAHAHSALQDSRNNYLLWKALTETHGIDYLPFIKTHIHKIECETIEQIDEEDQSTFSENEPVGDY